MRAYELMEKKQYKLFVDLDGVLADFEKGVLAVTGQSSKSLDLKTMWAKLADTTIKHGSPHHTMLDMMSRNEELTKDLRQHTKALRQLARLKLIDNNFSDITNQGQTVLADLDKGQNYVTGPNFYSNLDMMPDGNQLWGYVKKYNPTILTGIPRGNWAPPQKKAWVAKYLGSNVPVITGMARDKYTYAAKNHILIDDTQKNIDEWIRAQGIGILHINADNTIQQLKGLGL